MIEHMEATASDWYERPAAAQSFEAPLRAGLVRVARIRAAGRPVRRPLGAVQAADREIARQTAVRARALAEFAASRPASADRAQGEPGAMSSERWASRRNSSVG